MKHRQDQPRSHCSIRQDVKSLESPAFRRPSRKWSTSFDWSHVPRIPRGFVAKPGTSVLSRRSAEAAASCSPSCPCAAASTGLHPEEVRGISLDGFVHCGTVVGFRVFPETEHPSVPHWMLRVEIHGSLDERASPIPVACKGKIRTHVRVASGIEWVERDGPLRFMSARGDFLAEEERRR